MAITFVTVSANVEAASGNITMPAVATDNNDLIIAALTTRDNVVSTFPAGWTKYQEANNGANLRATLAWKRAVTPSNAAFTITHAAGNSIACTLAVFRGCDDTSNVINASSITNNTANSTCTAASITSTVDGCWLIFTMHDMDNGVSSAQTSAALGAMSERFDNAAGSGSDCAVSMATVAQVSAGTSGASTGSLSLGPDINCGANTFIAPLRTERMFEFFL